MVRAVGAAAVALAVLGGLPNCGGNPEGDGLPATPGSLFPPSWSVPPLPSASTITIGPTGPPPGPSPKVPALSSDYNGDGYGDVVLGGDRLKVRVLYGSASGLTVNGAQVLTQNSDDVPGTAGGPGYYWGSAIVSGNFDGDGYADAAIAGSGPVGGPNDVTVLYGSSNGLHATAEAKQKAELLQLNPLTGLPNSAYQLGAALAATDVNSDGRADLAISLTKAATAPAVLLQRGTASGLKNVNGDFVSLASFGLTALNDGVVGALAAGDFNGDARPDLAVGLPLADAGRVIDAGMVVVLPATPSGHLSSTGAYSFTQDSPGVPDSPTAHASFGGALAAGHINGDKYDDLAVSEWYPYYNADPQSRVTVFRGSATGLSAAGVQSVVIPPQPVGGGTVDAQLGRSLAILDTNGDTYGDLAIGSYELVPAQAGKQGAGTVHVLRGGQAGLSLVANKVVWTQDSPGVAFSPAFAYSGFGASLRAIVVKGSPYRSLVIGMVREHDGTPCGAVGVLPGSANGLTATGSQYLTPNVLPEGTTGGFCQQTAQVIG